MTLDLHTHSVYSDGNLTPEEIVDAAVAIGLSAVSITDHDNVLAYDRALAQAKKIEQEEEEKSIEVIPGIEVNTILGNTEIHILGYYADSQNSEFINLIKYQQHARIQQTSELIENLNRIANIQISIDDVKKLVIDGGSIGRPHIARAILNVGGARNISEAYRKYICDDSPTYVKRKTVSPHEAVEVIYEAGGIPVIAHPCDIDKPEELIKELMNYGLRGIEVYHRKHSPPMIEYYSSLVDKYDLIVTGGSDCHGTRANGNLFLGKTHVPQWVLEELRKEKNRLEIASS